MATAKLNSLGQLVSESAGDIAPIIVSSSILVNGLNADRVDGVEESSFLRTDASRTLTNILSVDTSGSIEIINEGKIKVGNFSMKQIGNVLSFSYEV